MINSIATRQMCVRNYKNVWVEINESCSKQKRMEVIWRGSRQVIDDEWL